MWTTNQFNILNQHQIWSNFPLLQIKLLQGAANAYTIERDSKFSKWFDSILIMDEREAHELSCQVKTLKSDVWDIQFDSGGAATDRGEQQQRVEVETHPSQLNHPLSWLESDLINLCIQPKEKHLGSWSKRLKNPVQANPANCEGSSLSISFPCSVLHLQQTWACPPKMSSHILNAAELQPYIPLFHQLCNPTTSLETLLEADPPIHLSSPILLIHFSISFPPDSEDGSPRLQTTERMTPLPAR